MPNAPVDRARRALAALRGTNDPDVAWLTAGLADYLARVPDVRLDEALGLHPGWGEKGWWTQEAKVARNALIAELDCQCFGQVAVRDAAIGMLALVRAYRERRPGLANNQIALLARMNGTGAAMPGQRQLVAIIAALRTEAGREIKGCFNFTSRISQRSAPLSPTEKEGA